jgi:hypothetical protein
MAIKKTHTFAPKKSDGKKKMEASNSKTKSANSKQSSKKKRNEFGDDDSL